MSAQLDEVVRISFEGLPYGLSVLDSTTLAELSHFLTTVTSLARTLLATKDKAVDFDEKTCLVLNEPDQNGSTISVSIRTDDNEHNTNPTKLALKDALAQVYETYCSANKDKPIPSQLPSQQLARLVKLGAKLPPKVEIAIKLPGTQITTVSAAARESLQKQLSFSTRSNVVIVGQIFAVNVKAKIFWMFNNENDLQVQVPYTDDLEDTVTHALSEYNSTEVRVGAVGTFDNEGNIKYIHQLNTLDLKYSHHFTSLNDGLTFEEYVDALIMKIPQDELDKLPPDLAENHDDYITGRKTY